MKKPPAYEKEVLPSWAALCPARRKEKAGLILTVHRTGDDVLLMQIKKGR